MGDEAPWLDEAEMATWLALIGLITRLPAAMDEQLRREAGLSHFEYGVLAALANAEDGSMRMSDLAYMCNGSLSRLSHVARRLESAGLIERSRARADGRSTIARLTGAGRDRLAEAAPGHVRQVRRLVFDELDAREVADLGAVLARLVERVEEESA